MKSFEQLGISESILQIIKEQGFENPTEIQERSIPLTLEGKDVLGWSATGSGKTLAFGTVIIERTQKGQGIQAMVLAPTRELARQVAKELGLYSRNKKLRIATIYGGVAIGPQMDDLQRADIVVGTPGRCLDHIGRGTIDLSKVKVMVLDEADKMFDMGFFEDVRDIINETPKNRQTLLFSATTSKKVVALAQRYMRDPIEITVQSRVDPAKLRQVYYDLNDNEKLSVLIHLLKNEESGLVMVFCNSRNNTDFVAKSLKFNGVDALAIHGGLSQDKRERIIKKFDSKRALVLCCTDVAARGLHIEGVSHIYNYDIPKEAKQYIHRIGRTARAGKEGIAINLLSYRDYDNFDRVLRENRDLEVEKMEKPEFKRVRIPPRDNSRDRGNNRFNSRDGGSRDRRPMQGRGGSNRMRKGSRHNRSMRSRD